MSSFYQSNQQQEQQLNTNNLIQIPKLNINQPMSSQSFNRTNTNKTNNFIYSSPNNKQQQIDQQFQEEIHHQIFDFNNNELNHSNNTTQQQQQEPVYLIFDEEQSQPDVLLLDDNNQQSWVVDNSIKTNPKPKNCTLNNKMQQSSIIVPALTNVDEIFYLLSQKIAKYCQILSDLTNCEVFYKAQLPLTQNQSTDSNKTNKKLKTIQTNSKLNKQRSLYWGTHQMLFQFSHDEGIKFDKTSGDSLIKLNHRSISTDVNQLIEEILNAPSNDLTKETEPDTTNKPTEEFNLINEIQQVQNEAQRQKDELVITNKPKTNDLIFKDCCIYLNRLNDDVTIDEYFNKFESKHNNFETNFMIGQDMIDNDANNANLTLSLNELPSDNELYSDQFTLNFNTKKSDDTDEDDEDEDDDEKTLLEKNCLNNSNEINENDENYYKCEQCPNGYSYRHLTQLKIHKLRKHLDISLNGSCQKCGLNNFVSQEDYLKHSILCYFPNAYQCKTCNQLYDNYAQYLFHIRYIHTHVVYMCAICHRKYKHIKDLIDHDQLMHSKSLNYCELCYESFKNRECLYDHYKLCHLNQHLQQNEDINKEKQLQHQERVQKPDSNLTKCFVLTTDQDDEEEEDEEDEEEQFVIKPLKNTKIIAKVHKNELIRGLIDRKHQCKWCSLRFYTKSQLKQHEQVHTNSVLNCPVCDKQFTSKDRLNGHMKCHMEPSLECKVCGKKFKRLCNLYNHELVHGLTEHAFMLCQFCGRGFRSRRDYQNHVIANHRDHLMKVDSDGTVIEEINDQNDSAALKTSRRRKAKKTQQVSTEINGTVTANDSSDDTYFTRTGISFPQDDYHFDEDEEENEDEDEFINNNNKRKKNYNNKSKNKVKKYKNMSLNNQIEVEEDVIQTQIFQTLQTNQINRNQTNVQRPPPTTGGILAHLFEESLS